MLLKLAIIIGLVVLGGIIFSVEFDTFFPNTASTVPASIGADVEKLSGEATVFIEERLNQSTLRLGEITGEATGSITERMQGAQDQATAGNITSPLDAFQGVLTGETDSEP